MLSVRSMTKSFIYICVCVCVMVEREREEKISDLQFKLQRATLTIPRSSATSNCFRYDKTRSQKQGSLARSVEWSTARGRRKKVINPISHAVLQKNTLLHSWQSSNSCAVTPTPRIVAKVNDYFILIYLKLSMLTYSVYN